MVVDGVADPIPPWGDRRRTRVGLLGGSFNPAHEGHAHVARLALRRLRLDQVWLMVSPGNPLKSSHGMASREQRLESARGIADGRRIVATAIEWRLGSRFTFDTLRALRLRFPRVRFVWLMGADNLVQLPRWQHWTGIAATMPFAVMPRPTYNQRALAGQAAQRLRPWLLPGRAGPCLAGAAAPAWTFLPAQQNAASATALRELGRTVPELAWPRPPEPARQPALASGD
jgi:nicotinate-nucleotide adenylyltransferase